MKRIRFSTLLMYNL